MSNEDIKHDDQNLVPGRRKFLNTAALAGLAGAGLSVGLSSCKQEAAPPAAAPATPPETGASRKRMPRAFAAAPTARAEATSMVEQSITRAPVGKAPSRSWPPPSDNQSPRT